VLTEGWFSRADFLRVHPSIAGATASRDLRDAVLYGTLEKRGERARTQYRFIPQR
jgi:hypothetical protein